MNTYSSRFAWFLITGHFNYQDHWRSTTKIYILKILKNGSGLTNHKIVRTYTYGDHNNPYVIKWDLCMTRHTHMHAHHISTLNLICTIPKISHTCQLLWFLTWDDEKRPYFCIEFMWVKWKLVHKTPLFIGLLQDHRIIAARHS
jgi:hypothetical protein